MKRTILSFLIILGAGFFTETLAQEDLLWQWRQEANKEQIAKNSGSSVQDRVQPEEFFRLGDYTMLEQTDPGVKQENPPTNQEQQDGVPVIEEEQKDPETEVQQSESPAMLLQRPDEGSSVTTPALPTIQPLQIQPEANKSKEEDSVLEFNFLYFLIQKFKLSEIMD